MSVLLDAFLWVRRYRKGELPDIQITRKDLLDPLQALCERSSLFARVVWGELFKARLSCLVLCLSVGYKVRFAVAVVLVRCFTRKRRQMDPGWRSAAQAGVHSLNG